jgi:hypothetical protein
MLLALALKAREDGQSQYADELTQLASDAQDEASPVEANPSPQPQARTAATRPTPAATAA